VPLPEIEPQASGHLFSYVIFLCLLYLFPFAVAVELCNNTNTSCYDDLFGCSGTVMCLPPVVRKILRSGSSLATRVTGLRGQTCINLIRKKNLVVKKSSRTRTSPVSYTSSFNLDIYF
jgi:hypothetical protein